jgi:Transcriptional Coactivator p15 (PC4)
MTARVTLPEPVPVDSFWRNRRHEAVVSTLSTYEGRNIFDIRIHAMKNGRLVPTPKGVAIVVLRLPDLAKAINKALKQAHELGLLDDEIETSV